MKITNRDLLKTSLKIICSNSSNFSDTFEQNLFKYSTFKSLFQQKRFRIESSVLFSILFFTVYNLDNSEKLTKFFEVFLSEYLAIEIILYSPFVRDAFLNTITSFFCDESLAEILQAWTEVYNLILQLILDYRSQNSSFNWNCPHFVDSLNRIRFEFAAQQFFAIDRFD